jgi:NodT family efflux transporter outer membrane factor (OMF) lipoprotein
MGNLQVGASWAPDFWGQHSAELAAAVGQARAAQADAAAAAQTLAAQVAHSYNGLARLLAQREVAQRALAQRQEMLNLTRQRVGAGLDTQVELAQAEGSLPDARLQSEMLDERIALSRHQLAVLTGQQPTALAGLSPALAAWGGTAVPPELGADLLGRRPDVVAARWRVEAATQGVALAKTQFYPNINLSAFIGLNAIGLDKVFESGSRQLGVAPALRLPLFDGGALRAQLSGRQAELDAAVGQYNSQVLDAVREARDAISSLQSLDRQWPEQQAALASAERAHQLSLQRYQAGLGSYLIVLNTEGQWLAQRRQAVDLQARQVDARVALLQALGGGVSQTVPPSGTAAARSALTTAAR